MNKKVLVKKAVKVNSWEKLNLWIGFNWINKKMQLKEIFWFGNIKSFS